jgi:hypothetical protein
MSQQNRKHPESEKKRYGNDKESLEQRDNKDASKRNIVKHAPDENIGAASGADNYQG